ncbi:hypothetical protein Ancab_020751 [Ancistrocladus abbreviatus]
MSEREEQQRPEMFAETTMQQLRSKAAELLLTEDWKGCIQAYSHFISLCQDPIHQQSNPACLASLQKSLCLSLSNRAEAWYRLRDFEEALKDCEQALQIDSIHFKTLVCKGKSLLCLNRHSMALECFKTALLDPQSNGNSETLNGFIEKCKKLELLSKNGALDVSDWVLSGFRGKSPELGEYVGSVEIKKSEISGRGLFATKNVDAGSLILVTKAIATERCILPKFGQDSGENAQLVMWKNFVDKVHESVRKCRKTSCLISTLSNGENEDDLAIPDINVFRPELEESDSLKEPLDIEKILGILDVNSIVEDAVSAKVLGKNSDYYGVGLWLLPSFINHSCSPNSRRLHIGDHVIVHASWDIKAGEEITFAYFDVLSPLSKREEMAKTWGFCCDCRRCKFEKKLHSKLELEEIEMCLERGVDVGCVIFRLEEYMRMCVLRGKEKGYIRASFWTAFAEAYQSAKTMCRWGRRMPPLEAVLDSIVEAVGCDERILKVSTEWLKRRSGGGLMEMEKVMKLGRGVYGKVMKKQAMRKLLQLGIQA